MALLLASILLIKEGSIAGASGSIDCYLPGVEILDEKALLGAALA